MKSTGIVRRLDDLGRLVIPKEIRKQYRLKEGDSIEFYTEENKIIIQKFDTMSKHLEEITYMCETLTKWYENPVFFIHDEIIADKQSMINENFINKCKVHRITNFTSVEVFQNENVMNGIIFPVTSYGDFFGAFVICFKNKEYEINQLDGIQAYVKLLARKQSQ